MVGVSSIMNNIEVPMNISYEEHMKYFNENGFPRNAEIGDMHLFPDETIYTLVSENEWKLGNHSTLSESEKIEGGASDIIADMRLAICNECKYLDRLWMTCEFENKYVYKYVYDKEATCPRQNW